MNTRAQVISRNFAILSVGRVVSSLLGFATTVHLAHVLLADRFGVIVFATGVLAYAGLIVDCGFDSLGALEAARGTLPLAILVRTVISLRLLLASVALVVLALVTWLTPISELVRTAILLYGLSLFTNAVDLTWAFLGAERMRPAVLAELLCQSIVTVGAFLLVWEPNHVLRMPLIFLGGRGVAVIVLLSQFFCHFGKFGLGMDFPLLKRLLAAALPFSGTAVVSMISYNFDQILVGLWLGTEAAGLYGAAYRVVLLPTMLGTAYFMALRPWLVRASVHGFHTIESLLRSSIRIVTALGIGVVVGGVLLAEPLITWLYGAPYQAARQPLQILLSAMALMFVSRHYRILLVAFRRQALEFKFMTAAAALNITLNVLLIPRLGLTGAALATLASEGLLLVVSYTLVYRLISHAPLGCSLVKPLASVALMALVLSNSLFLPLFVRMALGGGIYLALLFSLRVINFEDVRLVFRVRLPIRSATS
jgi:O-antigen/teichoic acid export membrane protein